MKKSLQQGAMAADEVVLIERNEIDELLKSVRWSEAEVSDKVNEEALRKELSVLLERPVLEAKGVDVERLTAITSDDIIDKFLRSESFRIVVDDSAAEKEVVTSVELDDEEDMVSEELAEVYLQQGLKEEAKATYRKLSLLNPEKSIYFAELIAKIDSNN